MIGKYCLLNNINCYKQLKIIYEKNDLTFEYEITVYNKKYCIEANNSKAIILLSNKVLTIDSIDNDLYIKNVIGLR